MRAQTFLAGGELLMASFGHGTIVDIVAWRIRNVLEGKRHKPE
jgi:hypothetical protein